MAVGRAYSGFSTDPFTPSGASVWAPARAAVPTGPPVCARTEQRPRAANLRQAGAAGMLRNRQDFQELLWECEAGRLLPPRVLA